MYTSFGDKIATGTANAYMNVHIQEGGSGPLMVTEYELYKAEDLVYSVSGTATGDVTLFEKVMNYHSKITGYMVWETVG